MTKPGVSEISRLSEYFAVKCNNDFWSLSETYVEPVAQPKLLTLAFASLYHWTEVGTAENIQLANMAVARALCLNNLLLSKIYAREAYNYFDGNGADWVQAFTNAVLSHSMLIADEVEKAIPLYEKAIDYQSKLSKGDKGVFDATFRLIPDPRK